jgi:acetyl-CoA C-acetyltransferase
MSDVVIVEAVRTPIGKRNGGLSTFHPVDLLALVQQALVDRSGIDPIEIEQIVGGCISQVGAQAFNVTRTAWLRAGLPESSACTTVDCQCGSSQQATSIAASFVAAGVVDAAAACGVEIMSRVPMGSSLAGGTYGKAVPKSYFAVHEYTTQFEAAERIAEHWKISREELDQLGLESQRRAAVAWAEGRFDTQVLPVDAPVLGEDGKPTGETTSANRDEGLRETTIEGLAALKPVARETNGFHTAGTASQISDAAAAVLLMSADKAKALGLKPRARIVDSCLVGSNPTMMLTAPIDATQRLFKRTGLTIDNMDVTEINEAFASVVLSWEREIKPDMAKVNPNGGAIALGHALGSTGAVLLTKALHELERTDGEHALVTMCCGGGLGTGTILQRV